MTQNKTVIQSGNQTLRAYSDDGVLTPASGLEEYKYIIITDDIDGGNEVSYELFNDFPLLVVSFYVKLEFTDSNTNLFFRLRSSGSNEFQFPLVQEDTAFSNTTGNVTVVIPPNDELTVQPDAGNLKELRILCKRVALSEPITPRQS
jgi:hypothetical protein